MPETTLVWLRNDLRIADNPCLWAAAARGGRVVAAHVEETDPALRPRGAASRWWLHRSLIALSADLAALGIPLLTLRGSIDDAVDRVRPDRVHWNRRYGPAEREADRASKERLRARGIAVESFMGDVLAEPFAIATRSGGPYGVYTPFWKALAAQEVAMPLRAPAPVAPALPLAPVDSDYRAPAWAGKFERHWNIGEAAAQARLTRFLDHIAGYPEGRDIPGRAATSRLSPHLAFGEISPRQVWHAAGALAHRRPDLGPAVEKFLRELAWRDFNLHQLFHREDIATVPMQRRFEALPWRNAPADLAAWQRGATGFAIVDAGMRELWETGFMHNRVRMIVASFLSKNLLIDWRRGEQWFWDCLVDADAANNPGNWQWVAGCGTDAAPFFRIFNPLTQAQRFDPDGRYVRRWAPPPADPIVDLAASRRRALAAFAGLADGKGIRVGAL